MATRIHRFLPLGRGTVAAAALLLVLAVALRADDPAAENTARIRAGDRLYIHLAEALPDYPLKGVYLVEPTGKLPLGPMYGRVAASGLTVEEAEARVQDHMKTIIREPKLSLTWYDSAAHGEPALQDRIARLEKELAELRAAVVKLGKR